MGNQSSSTDDGKAAIETGHTTSSPSSSPNQTPRIGGRRKKMQKELSQEQLHRACREVQHVIFEVRQRAGTELVCAQLHRTWESHFDQIAVAWDGLTLPARRCMVQNMREKVIKRARALHRIVSIKDRKRRHHSQKEKERIVSKLMEKICSELFDTDVLYNGHKLLDVLGRILECGGGSECPPLVVAEVYHSFDVTEESLKRSRSTNHVQNNNSSMNGHKQRSVEDMRWLRRQESSACVVDLLSFLPQEMELESRKALTIKLVSEMRNAFLVHFAVLVFGELIDDYDLVVRKYEYGSESETECATSETNWSDSDVDHESEEVDEDGDSQGSEEGILIDSPSQLPQLRDSELGRSLTTPSSWAVGEQHAQVALSGDGVHVDVDVENEKKINDVEGEKVHISGGVGVDSNEKKNKNNNKNEVDMMEVKQASERELTNMQQPQVVVGNGAKIESDLRLGSREAQTVATR